MFLVINLRITYMFEDKEEEHWAQTHLVISLQITNNTNDLVILLQITMFQQSQKP